MMSSTILRQVVGAALAYRLRSILHDESVGALSWWTLPPCNPLNLSITFLHRLNGQLERATIVLLRINSLPLRCDKIIATNKLGDVRLVRIHFPSESALHQVGLDSIRLLYPILALIIPVLWNMRPLPQFNNNFTSILNNLPNDGSRFQQSSIRGKNSLGHPECVRVLLSLHSIRHCQGKPSDMLLASATGHLKFHIATIGYHPHPADAFLRASSATP
mmetsp:Transcript_47268/g.86802  ORF Transcript_47268/g.86802 Transcript_47268/m.86802 type:complete len:218 (+) Transcript_47268:1231-1884(+)